MEKRKVAGWLVLTGIVVVAAVALGVTNLVTEGPIAEQNMEQSQGALRSFFPDAQNGDYKPLTVTKESGLDSLEEVSQNGSVVGYAAQITVQGYAGPVEVTLGVKPDGSLIGIAVGGGAFKETEGLGAKAKDSDFTDQFAGKTPPLSVGGDIEGISGATVTSKAVTNAVNTATEAVLGAIGQAPTASGQPAAQGGATVANASVMSYGGPVLVNLRLDENGAITEIEIGKERFMESEGYGSKVKDDAFREQFIGKTPPLTLGSDIDAVSGATGSSQAVIDAVNAAWQFAKGK